MSRIKDKPQKKKCSSFLSSQQILGFHYPQLDMDLQVLKVLERSVLKISKMKWRDAVQRQISVFARVEPALADKTSTSARPPLSAHVYSASLFELHHITA